MTIGEIIFRNMRVSMKRASANYSSGNKELARFWLGGCGALKTIAESLSEHLSDREIRQLIEIGERARAIFTEQEFDVAEENPPDRHAQALDEYLAENGI